MCIVSRGWHVYVHVYVCGMLLAQADSCDISDFRCLAKLSSQLKEFAFMADACNLSTPGDLAHAHAAGARPGVGYDFSGVRIAVSKLLPSTTVNIFSCNEVDENCVEGGLSRHFIPGLLEQWQRTAVGPLHNSADPKVLAALREDQHVHEQMSRLATASRRTADEPLTHDELQSLSLDALEIGARW